jgi:type II secretory pathway component PulM
MVVAASVLLVLVLLYTLFFAYLPARQRLARLEAELKDVAAHEAELQTRLDAQEQRSAARERQFRTLTTERDALARRLEDLERELSGRPRR